jgi:hypothetical protein
MFLKLQGIPNMKYIIGTSLAVFYIGGKFKEVLVTLSLHLIMDYIIHLMYIMLVKKTKNPESIINAELPGRFLKKLAKC